MIGSCVCVCGHLDTTHHENRTGRCSGWVTERCTCTRFRPSPLYSNNQPLNNQPLPAERPSPPRKPKKVR